MDLDLDFGIGLWTRTLDSDLDCDNFDDYLSIEVLGNMNCEQLNERHLRIVQNHQQHVIMTTHWRHETRLMICILTTLFE